MASSPFLAITLDLKRRLDRAARAIGVDRGLIFAGALDLLEHVWERKDPAVSALVVAACFGPDPRVAPALVEFGLLVVAGPGWELCQEETDRLLAKPAERPAHAPIVYLVRVGDDGPIKIGFTANLRQRMRALQVGHPGRLRVLRKIETDDPAALETALHERFAHLSLGGEWFRADPELLAFSEES